MAERIMSPDLLPDSTIAVIGAGNGGQAMAGFLALRGFGGKSMEPVRKHDK